MAVISFIGSPRVMGLRQANTRHSKKRSASTLSSLCAKQKSQPTCPVSGLERAQIFCDAHFWCIKRAQIAQFWCAVNRQGGFDGVC
ncbi:MAG: hypothetical protein ACKO69_11410, partial [Limnohabitans sp.]